MQPGLGQNINLHMFFMSKMISLVIWKCLFYPYVPFTRSSVDKYTAIKSVQKSVLHEKKYHLSKIKKVAFCTHCLWLPHKNLALLCTRALHSCKRVPNFHEGAIKNECKKVLYIFFFENLLLLSIWGKSKTNLEGKKVRSQKFFMVSPNDVTNTSHTVLDHYMEIKFYVLKFRFFATFGFAGCI